MSYIVNFDPNSGNPTQYQPGSFDECYRSGTYIDQDCWSCPYKYDCSGYAGDDDNE